MTLRSIRIRRWHQGEIPSSRPHKIPEPFLFTIVTSTDLSSRHANAILAMIMVTPRAVADIVAEHHLAVCRHPGPAAPAQLAGTGRRRCHHQCAATFDAAISIVGW